MGKVWRYHPTGCDCCGGTSEIKTEPNIPEGHGYDGDSLRCMDCDNVGHWTVYAEDDAYANWDCAE